MSARVTDKFGTQRPCLYCGRCVGCGLSIRVGGVPVVSIGWICRPNILLDVYFYRTTPTDYV